MRILMITPYPPSAIRVRPLHVLRGLVRRGHEVSLLCPVHNPGEAEDLEALRPFCADVTGVPTGRSAALRACLQALPSSLPLQAAYELSPQLVAAVRATIAAGGFDLVHIEHLRAAQVVLAATEGLSEVPPLIIDAVDCISLLFERALRGSPSLGSRVTALLDLARTRRYEAAYSDRFANVIVTSPEDAWAIQTLRTQFGLPAAPPPQVVANGVDTDYFAPCAAPREEATLVFSGKMSYHANHAAAMFLLSAIMPLVWRDRPEVRVIIAGANPGPAIRAYDANPQVEVTGYVPSLQPYLARATLAVAPIRYGVGIQNKVLEAMAAGLPVITSPQATRALSASPGRDLLVAEDAPGFAQQVLAALDSPQRCAALGARGRQYVLRNHSWESRIAALEESYIAAGAYVPDWVEHELEVGYSPPSPPLMAREVGADS
jgi:polysaccharide biosynthesis protein PslH